MVVFFARRLSMATRTRDSSSCISIAETSTLSFVFRYLPLTSTIFVSAIILCSLLLFTPVVMAATNQRDVEALSALHQSWSQKPYSWDITTDPCQDQWPGIQCDSSNTTVVSLFLINQQLVGNLSSVIGNLTDLRELDLSSNPMLGGNLPKEIGNLKVLERLFLQFCSFSGSIPSEIGNMRNLTHFGLTRNAFVGNLPSEIGQLTSLIWIDLSSNQLSGSLPESGTSTSGVGLDNLTKAEHFHLENNSFSGSIPSSIFNANMSLIHLLLDHNNFSGSIPATIGDMQRLEILRFDHNSLNGTVPQNISNVKTLVTLQLNDNNLTGQLPDLSNNTNLQMIYLSNNPFDPAEIPSWIRNLSKLCLLSMDSINLFGSIPSEIFSSSANISNVTLASNILNGTLNLTSASASILIVDVHNNNLTNLSVGTVTPEIVLDQNPYCYNNQTQCDKLKQQTPGVPPPGALQCSGACEDGYTINPKSSNSCSCSLPVVGTVDFLANKLPVLLNNGVSSIEALYATRLTETTNLTFYVDQVVVKVISYNEIVISVFPADGLKVWSTSTAAFISFYLKNQQISVDSVGPLVCEFTGNPYGTVTVVNKLSVGAKIGIAVAVIIFVVVVVILTLFAIKQKKRAEKAEKLNKPFAAWIGSAQGDLNIPQLKGARWFSLDEIRNCTNHFNRNNEIGEGGYGKVYKGFLESGLKVAIKRASTDSLQGVHEFKNEIELLSRVHHRNLVGLIGFCFEEGEQMLVYEFITNGTLRECLSGKTGINMDWERRVQLALGSAKGIAYLHSEANPPIIHRDIKSSNILLDDRLVAKVADFGLSKLAPVDEDGPPLSTQVKGTLGYLDPDYFMTNRLTDKSDVYSFGVVLLELLTGRLPIQDGKYVVREIRTAFARGGMELVVESMLDPQLREFPLIGVEKLVELALACVQDDPNMRPSMTEVVKDIEICLNLPYFNEEDRQKVTQMHTPPHHGELTPAERNLKSSFEYSGSIIGKSTILEPK